MCTGKGSIFTVSLFLLAGLLAALLGGGRPAPVAAATGSDATGTWVFETIQLPTTPSNMGPRSLALDAYGHPHLALGGQHLYYAHHDGQRWQIELVDPSEMVGGYTSLALDAAGYPHISYYDEGNQDLKYAAFDGTAWHIERIDGDGAVGAHTSLALNAAGRAQISYYDQSAAAVKLAWQDDTGWHTAALDSMSGSRPGSALALDAAGRPAVAYVHAGLRYAYVDASDIWHYDLVDASAVGGPIALALDGNGRPHLTYCEVGWRNVCTGLRYAYHDGEQWLIRRLITDRWGGESNSLALDRLDRPHIAFQADYSSGPLHYAHYDGLSWHDETIDTSSGCVSLLLDPSGRPHIGYYAPGAGVFKYARLVPPTFADPAFEALWQRTDRPVASGLVARSWMWGDRPLTAGLFEPYADAPDGSRLVQYYDKSRMEINNPAGNRSSPWFVTNGLLVREMVEGWIQLGDNTFERRTPSGETVAGDAVAGNPNCPLYASFSGLTGWAAPRLGQKVSATLARDGTVGDDPAKAAYEGTTIAYYEPVTGHNVPQALWRFMNQQGLIYQGGRYRQGLLVDWVFAMGYPISEPYWTRCTVAGVEQDVLVQLFERRVLTYTPANPAGWQVEMGNVGRHYYTWRYGVTPEP